jgi:WD40 repeat protein
MQMNYKISKLSMHTDHVQAIYALETDESKKRLYSAGSDRLVIERNLDDPDKITVIAQASAVVYALHLLADKNTLLIAQRDGVLHFLDVDKKVLIKSLKISEKEIFAVRQLPGTEEIIICCGDGKVLRCRTTDYSIINADSSSDKSARCISVHPHKKEIAIGYSDNSIRVFDHHLKLLYTIEAHASSVFSLAYAEDGMLYSGSRDAHLKVWNSDTDYALVNDIIPHLYTINDIQFYPGKNIFATASRDKSIRIWETGTLKLLRSIDKEKSDGHSHSVNKIKWIPSQNILISAGDDSKLIVWGLDK